MSTGSVSATAPMLTALPPRRTAPRACSIVAACVAGAEIPNAPRLLERDGGGRADRRVWRRVNVFADPAIGIEVVDLLRIRAEPEVAVEGEKTAAAALTAAAHRAGVA